MKIQILQLDPTDDQISIRDKLTRVKADRVLLVWPRRGQPISDRLDLVLINRKARDLGLQLGLLSHDPQVNDAARQIGIPLFETVQEASQADWPEPERLAYPARPNAATKKDLLDDASQREGQTGWRTGGLPIWLRVVVFSSAVLALVALAAALAPAATVTIAPETEIRQLNQTIWIESEGESLDPTAAAIPGQLRTTTVTASERAETTGSSRVADQTASGQLLFTNLTQESVTLAEGTSVRASAIEGVRFVTTEPAELAPEQGAVVQVPARAAVAGPEGNVSAGAIDAVDGPVGIQVQVTNPDPFQGGTERVQPIVADRDLQRLRLELERALLDQALDRLEDSLPADQDLLTPSLQIEEVIELEYDAEEGQPAGSLGLSMSAEVSALAYSIEDLRAGVQQLIRTSNEPEWKPVPGSLTILEREGLSSGGRFGIGVAAQWQAYQPVEEDLVKRWLVAEPADKDLSGLPVDGEVEVREAQIWPNWSPIYPFLSHRISIRYPWQGQQ